MRLIPLILLSLAACGQHPSGGAETVAVVNGSGASAADHPVVRLPTPTPAATIASPSKQSELLTVEESAHIQTTEMWSEPIKQVD